MLLVKFQFDEQLDKFRFVKPISKRTLMYLSAYHAVCDFALRQRLPLHKGAVPESVPITKNGPVSKSQVRFTVLRTAPESRRVFFIEFFRVSAQPEGVSKRFRSGETRQSTAKRYTLGMRVVGIWRFCR